MVTFFGKGWQGWDINMILFNELRFRYGVPIMI